MVAEQRHAQAQEGDGRAAVGTGLVGGESREREVVAEEREVAEQRWVTGLMEGESHEQKVAAEEQEVVAERRRGLGPRWRRVAQAGGRAVAGPWAMAS